MMCVHRGVSSTVRRCIEKSTGRQYAVKIFEMSEGDHCDDDPTSLAVDEELEELRKSTMKEVDILKVCAGQPHISESDSFQLLSPTKLIVCFRLTIKRLYKVVL